MLNGEKSPHRRLTPGRMFWLLGLVFGTVAGGVVAYGLVVAAPSSTTTQG
jgi:hypothetical protein